MIKDKIKQIKYSRLKPEERFLHEMIDGIYECDKYSKYGSIFYIKNDMVLFEQDFNERYLRINFKLIWMVISELYDKEYDYIQFIISSILIKYTNLGTLTTITCSGTNDIDCRYLDYEKLNKN